MKPSFLSSKKRIITVLLAAIAAAAAFSVYCFYENNTLVTSDYEISDEKITKDFDGFVIAQVSDFHNCQSEILRDSLLTELKRITPDIIAVTGDFIDSRKTDIPLAEEYMKQLLSIAPVYMSAGNHEAAAYGEYPAFQKKLTSLGVTVLRNSAVSLAKGRSHINIMGIDDPVFFSEGTKYENTENSIIAASSDKDAFTLTLSHRPELFEVYVKTELDLVLSGHAHGGQIRIPFKGGVFTPTEGLFPEYTEGLHEKNGTKMAVSRGIGASVFPVRINNRPELVVITLKCA